jgi:hypothetical protein
MGFLDWMGRDRGPIIGTEPRVTWMSDVYAYHSPGAHGPLKESWAWAWVHETPSGAFNAGITVRDAHFDFTKWKTGEGFTKEAEAINRAQRCFKAWRKRGPETRLAGPEIQRHVKNWYQAAERISPKRYEGHRRGRSIDF